MRVPVVASPAAFNGINAVAGRDILVAPSFETFSEAISNLLRNAGERERLASNGRSCVEQNHRWDVVLDRLEKVVVGSGVVQELPHS